jgi:hypothetical protein
MTQWTAAATAWSLARARNDSSAALPDAVRRRLRHGSDAEDRATLTSHKRPICSQNPPSLIVGEGWLFTVSSTAGVTVPPLEGGWAGSAAGVDRTNRATSLLRN